MIRSAFWLLPLSIAACAPATETEAAANMSEPERPAAAARPAALDGEGVRFVDPSTGATRLLAFGTPSQPALAALGTAMGPPAERQVNSDCGAGPILHVQWPNGFTALIQEERFLGWGVAEPGLTTMDGVGLGSRRSQIEQGRQISVEETTLGTEFRSGDIGGLLSSDQADAEITHLWAGLTCHFR